MIKSLIVLLILLSASFVSGLAAGVKIQQREIKKYVEGETE